MASTAIGTLNDAAMGTGRGTGQTGGTDGAARGTSAHGDSSKPSRLRAAAPSIRRSLVSAATGVLVVGSLVLGAGAGHDTQAPGTNDVSVSGVSGSAATNLHDQLVPPGVDVPGVTDVHLSH